MRVLFITNHFVDGNGGGSFASRAYANAFSEIAEQCIVLHPTKGEDIRHIIPNGITLGIKNDKPAILKFFDIYRGSIHRYTEIAPRLTKLFNPDIVVFDNSRCSYNTIKKIRECHAKTITIHHNYEAEYYYDELRLQKTTNILFWKQRLLHYIRRAECESVNNSDINLTLTHQDIGLINSAYANSNKSSFHRIGCFEYRNRDYKAIACGEKNHESHVFAITGNLSNNQTTQSITSFVRDFFPLVSQVFPNTQLILAGKDPSEEIREVCSHFPNIQIIANPVNMQAVIRQADVYICPANTGGGMKLRVMDGLQLGLPVLCHKISSRGYEAFSESGILFTYTDTQSFKESIQKIRNKFDNQAFNRASIIDQYISEFSFASGVKRLQSILESGIRLSASRLAKS